MTPRVLRLNVLQREASDLFWRLSSSGTGKIVPDLNTALRRIYEYCFPLEDARARQAYGVPRGVNNLLIINRTVFSGRLTAIMVNEVLGF